MPLPKIKVSGATDVMNADNGNDSLDTFIRHAIGKEPFLSLSRANDSPVQWIQLLHALDQQDQPGWPLLSPLKVQMQKCDKCSREFSSTINYRRHMRLHRRNLNLDKDSTSRNRDLLQAFWDKLSVEATMEIMSFKDVSLEGVAGSSIIKALTSFIRKPGFTSLPQSYIRGGSALLDIVQARPSRFPVSSQELFSILDDASEKTFLCAGTAESLQKYVFDGEAGKIGLEMRNLVACISFLVEQKLVKACLADKDAEALKYQKLLVEEEEAAQKRQAALLEKKRQKKLKQKERRAKEQASAETDYSPEERSPSPPTTSPVASPDSILKMSEISHTPVSSPEHVQIMNLEGHVDTDHANGYPDLGTYQNIEHKTLHRSGRRHVGNSRWQTLKLQKSSNGFHTGHNYQVLKPGPMQKHVSYRDSRASSAASGGKVWTPKPKSETDEESYNVRLHVQAENLPSQDKKCEVFIGSIPVTLGNHSSQHDNGGQPPGRNCDDYSEVGSVSCNDSSEVPLVRPTLSNFSGCEENPDSSLEDGGDKGGSRFSSHVAEAFLAKRWKEAIASDHVKLVLFPEPEPPPGCPDVQDLEHRCILTSTENRLTCYTTLESSAVMKAKGSKVKYIPKQRSAA